MSCDVLPDCDQDGRPTTGTWICWNENNKTSSARINGDFGCVSRAFKNLKTGKGTAEDLLGVLSPRDRDMVVKILHHIEE